MNAKDMDKTRVNRRLISLRHEVMEARLRWETIIQPHVIEVRKVIGESKRSPVKILYLIHRGSWWDVIQKELEVLKARVASASEKGAKKSRKLWLPTVINNAEKITLKLYRAMSVRNVYLESAEKFAKKASYGKTLLDRQYAVVSQTGIQYQLSVHGPAEEKHYPFSDWAVCLCYEGALPILKKKRIKPVPSDWGSRKVICSYKNSALFIRCGPKYRLNLLQPRKPNIEKRLIPYKLVVRPYSGPVSDGRMKLFRAVRGSEQW